MTKVDARYRERARTAEQAGAGSLSPTLCLDLAHEAREIRSEPAGDAIHVQEPDVAQAPLDVADVRSVDAYVLSQPLLGQAADRPEPSDGPPASRSGNRWATWA